MVEAEGPVHANTATSFTGAVDESPLQCSSAHHPRLLEDEVDECNLYKQADYS